MGYLLNPSILSPQFITDGLILHLDADNTSSYSGSGTVWNDLSTSGYNYNVVQSTYRHILPKYFAFQPGNGGIAKSQDITNPAAPTSYTIMVWTRVRNSSSDWRTLARPYNNDHHVLNLSGGWEMGAYDNDEGGGFISSGFDQRNLANYPEWVCLHFKFSRATSPNWQMSWNDSAGTTRASINDVRACPPTILGNLGGWGNGTVNPADFSQAWGDIGAFYMWNRHLTVEEQNQNYELTKNRYVGKSIVADGLVVDLDFSNNASYPGTGTMVYDISGRSNNATLTNSPSYSTDASGSISLNGSNQLITGVHNSDVELISNMTSEVWFKLEADPGDWVRVIGKGTVSNRTYGLWYNRASSYFLYQRYGSTNMNVLHTATVNIGTWYHLAGVTIGTNNYLYLNGSLVGTTVGGATYATSTEPYTLGKQPENHAHHNGKIGEGRIYNRGLSANEISINFNATKSRYGL
jgi:hypothetical protein